MQTGTLGRALRLLRKEMHLTQSMASVRSGISRGQINRYEGGHDLPRLKTLMEYVEGLGRTLADLESAGDLLEAGSTEAEVIEMRHDFAVGGVSLKRGVIRALLDLRALEAEMYVIVDDEVLNH